MCAWALSHATELGDGDGRDDCGSGRGGRAGDRAASGRGELDWDGRKLLGFDFLDFEAGDAWSDAREDFPWDGSCSAGVVEC